MPVRGVLPYPSADGMKIRRVPPTFMPSMPLTNPAIAEIVARQPVGGPDTLCQALVDAANAAGGPDNITVIVIEVT